MLLHAGTQQEALTSPSSAALDFATLWSVLSIGYLLVAAMAFAFGTIGLRLESVWIVWCGCWCFDLRSLLWEPVSDDA